MANQIYTIPDFSLTELCGKGGSSEVWVGIDPCGIRRAIRIFPKDKGENLLMQERYAIRTYRHIASHHPHLLDFLYVGETEKCLYCITELADSAGKDQYKPNTLTWRIKYAHEPVEILRKHLSDILDAIEYLHNAGLAHNDLKPENILFVNDVLKVADPGLIAELSSQCFAGTPEYLPEWHHCGREADIYAFGKILYCMFSGNEPEKFPELTLNRRLSQWFDLNAIMLKCCEKDVRLRYFSVSEIRRDLRKTERKHFFKRLFQKKSTIGILLLAVLCLASILMNLIFLL